MPSYSTQWFTWNPSLGPLSVSLGQGVPNSVWLPASFTSVTFANNAVPFYVTQGIGNELVPIPSDTTALTLSGAGLQLTTDSGLSLTTDSGLLLTTNTAASGTMQVFASAAVLTPTRTIGG